MLSVLIVLGLISGKRSLLFLFITMNKGYYELIVGEDIRVDYQYTLNHIIIS